MRKPFEKSRVGYVTEKDKEDLLKVKNFLYGHMNVEKLTKTIKQTKNVSHGSPVPFKQEDRL